MIYTIITSIILVSYIFLGIGKYFCNDKCTEIYDKLFITKSYVFSEIHYYTDRSYHCYIPTLCIFISSIIVQLCDITQHKTWGFIAVILFVIALGWIAYLLLMLISTLLICGFCKLCEYHRNLKAYKEVVKLREQAKSTDDSKQEPESKNSAMYINISGKSK